MRRLAGADRVRALMRALGAAARGAERVYLTGGATGAERGHAQDRIDVASMIAAGLVEPGRLLELFVSASDRLHRYPAIDPAALRRALDAVVAGRWRG